MSIPLSSAGNHSASKTNEVKTNDQICIRVTTAALSMSAGAALAGPYVNVETNAGWVGDDYSGATTDIHVTMKEKLVLLPTTSKQAPAVVAVDGEETDTQFSGKAGLGIPVSDALSAYGEVSFLTTEDDDDFGLGGSSGDSSTTSEL